MSIFFISDLHLEEKKPHLTEAFKNFINSKLSPKDELFILGDFFEQWIGDDYEDNFIKSIKDVLKKISNSGTKIFLMHGNRDFLIGQKFCKEVGANLIEDPYTLEIDNRKILLMHGLSLIHI